METTNQPTSTVNVAPFGYAGFWRRLYANIIDSLIIGVVASPLSYTISSSVKNSSDTTTTNIGIFSFIISFAYVAFFWVSQNGQTLGKRIMGVRVIKDDGSPVDLATAVVRYIGYALSSLIFCLGYLAAAFDSRKRAWHDRIAHTLVVRVDDQKRTGRMILMSLFTFIVPVFFIIAIVSFGYLISNVSKSDKNNAVLNSFNLVPTRTQVSTENLEDQVFSDINTYRSSLSLKPLKTNSQLCAYAQRRLGQLQDFGKFDDGKGFYEDTADATIKRAYFSDFSYIGENSAEITGLTTSSNVVNKWKSITDSYISAAKYTDGCVRTNDKFILLIVAEEK